VLKNVISLINSHTFPHKGIFCFENSQDAEKLNQKRSEKENRLEELNSRLIAG